MSLLRCQIAKVRLIVNPYEIRPEEYDYVNNVRTVSWEFDSDAPEI